eukprot:7457586-Pyramimonas_sp.AAC.1
MQPGELGPEGDSAAQHGEQSAIAQRCAPATALHSAPQLRRQARANWRADNAPHTRQAPVPNTSGA